MCASAGVRRRARELLSEFVAGLSPPIRGCATEFLVSALALRTGVECYLNGDRRPAVVLLEYMAAKRFAAPKGWLGCRRDDYEDDADALRV